MNFPEIAQVRWLVFGLLVLMPTIVAAQNAVGNGVEPPTEILPGEAEGPREAEGSREAKGSREAGEEVDQLEVLRDLKKRMQELDRDFANRQTSQQVQRKQQDIIAGLKRLLEDQERSPQNGESKASQQVADQQPEQQEQPEDDDTQGKAPKQNGNSVSDDETPASVQSAINQKMQERIWGHLPDRIRDRVSNVNGETFLPKYERLIRSYYERLASESTDD